MRAPSPRNSSHAFKSFLISAPLNGFTCVRSTLGSFTGLRRILREPVGGMAEGEEGTQVLELLLLSNRRVRERVAEVPEELDGQPLKGDSIASIAERQQFAFQEASILLQARLFEVPRSCVGEELLNGFGDGGNLDALLSELSSRLPATNEVRCRFPGAKVERDNSGSANLMRSVSIVFTTC